MNKRSVRKSKPAKASRKIADRKAPVRKASTARKAAVARNGAARVVAREQAPKPEANTVVTATAVSVMEVMARASAMRAHKYCVGQAVFYTSSPITRPGASGSYKVVRLLPSDGDDYQYRIKNPGEAFERVAKESQLDLDR